MKTRPFTFLFSGFLDCIVFRFPYHPNESAKVGLIACGKTPIRQIGRGAALHLEGYGYCQQALGLQPVAVL